MSEADLRLAESGDLGSNRSLKRNLEKQVEIYQMANRPSTSVKAILHNKRQDEARISKILRELKFDAEPSVARIDDMPSGSKA